VAFETNSNADRHARKSDTEIRRKLRKPRELKSKIFSVSQELCVGFVVSSFCQKIGSLTCPGNEQDGIESYPT